MITGHSSARRNLPTFAFCDVVYDGEQFVSRVSADPDYANILDDNYCRSFFGTQYGIVPMLMPAYYNNEKMATTEVHPTETMYLHSLVYGFIIHSHRINNRVTDSILDITLPFGIGEAEFIPPYEAAAQAKYVKLAAQGDLRMGVYRNPAGRLLVAVGNFGAAKATAVLDFAVHSEQAGTTFPSLLLTTRLSNPSNPSIPNIQNNQSFLMICWRMWVAWLPYNLLR